MQLRLALQFPVLIKWNKTCILLQHVTCVTSFYGRIILSMLVKAECKGFYTCFNLISDYLVLLLVISVCVVHHCLGLLQALKSRGTKGFNLQTSLLGHCTDILIFHRASSLHILKLRPLPVQHPKNWCMEIAFEKWYRWTALLCSLK